MRLRELRDLLQTAPEEWLDGEIYSTSNLAIRLPEQAGYVGFVDLVEKRFRCMATIGRDMGLPGLSSLNGHTDLG